MTSAHSPRLLAYASIAGASFVAALAFGRLELVVVAAPFLLAATIAVAGLEPRITGSFAIESRRVSEQDDVVVDVRLDGVRGVASIDLLLILPDGLTAIGENPVNGDASKSTVSFRVRSERWGAFRVGPVHARGRDFFGFRSWETIVGEPEILRVYPAEQTIRALLDPADTQVYVGNRLSRERGEGIEFADTRRWSPGDQLRRINWRVSARRDELWVNEQRPDRNSDIILFLDTSNAGGSRAEGVLEAVLRAAGTLARQYLQERDRVGVVGFGGHVSWVVPAPGVRQLYRITDTLLGLDAVQTFMTPDVKLLPPRSLPPKALVIALTPLLDSSSATALLDLRRRGFDLVVFELDPTPYVATGTDDTSRLAYRLWRLSREASRQRYREAGIPIVEWNQQRSLDDVIREATSFRRHRRRVGA